MFCAAEIGYKDTVVALVEARAAIDAVNPDGETVVTCAARGKGSDATETMNYLLSVGGSVGNALFCAVRSGVRTDVVTMLLRAGAAPDAFDDNGDTVLDLAVSGGAENAAEIVKRLLDVGALISRTALMRAVQAANDELIKVLLSHDGSLAEKLEVTQTALDEWTQGLKDEKVRSDIYSLFKEASQKNSD